MEQWVLSWWHVIAFWLGVVLIPAIGWAIRIGLASKADLAQETDARGEALGQLEGRLAGRLDTIEREQGALSDRTLRMETEILHLPTSGDISDLKAQLGRTDTRIDGVMREMSSIGQSLKRIEDHLIERAG